MTPERLAEIRMMLGDPPAPGGTMIARELLAEVERLTRWKAEATEVIEAWEKVHVALGEPGKLGESKAAASLAEVQRRVLEPVVNQTPQGSTP